MLRRLIMLVALFSAAAHDAHAQVHGVAVQVSQGQAVPTRAQLNQVIEAGDFVRDLAPWSRTDPGCNLIADPHARIVIPNELQTLYANVAAVGGKNFLTLGFNNVACGI